MNQVLTPHALREEHGIFAELEHAGVAHSYINMFEADHGHIHQLLIAAAAAFTWLRNVRLLQFAVVVFAVNPD